ncbi:MAG: ATP-binding cassette domain-containing protein, partial [Clostridia bacterium]|nr:ATP-binding cassette domain-containing protein [Clostridia bacterium]
KDSYAHYAVADIRDEYVFYPLYSDFVYPENFEMEINSYIDEAIGESCAEYCSEDGFLFRNIVDGVYSVMVLPDSVYGRIMYLDESFDGIVGTVSIYTVDFYEKSDVSDDKKYLAELFMSAEENLLVYGKSGEVKGRLSQYVFRAYDGSDIFSVEQKDELKRIVYGEEKECEYSNVLDENLRIEKNGNSADIFNLESRRLIDTYAKPSKEHILGTDSNGMDVLARLMYGGKMSLVIGIVTAVLSVLFGTVVGCISGCFCNKTDAVLMRITEAFSCIPVMPVLVTVGAAMNVTDFSEIKRIVLIIAVLVLFGWTDTAVVIRGQMLSLKKRCSNDAAKLSGISAFRRIVFHMLPETAPHIISSVSIAVSSAIFSESTLSFLGMGVKFPNATWGSMISENCSLGSLGEHPTIWIPTSVMILLTVFGFYLAGEGLIRTFSKRESVAYELKENFTNCGEIKTYPKSIDEQNILEVRNLSVRFINHGDTSKGFGFMNFSVKRGEITALIGPSGCGKSVSADCIVGLLRENAVASGEILYSGSDGVFDILKCSEEQKVRIRGSEIGYIMQEPMSCFDPIMKVGKQIEESVRIKHPGISEKEAKKKTVALLKKCGFPDCADKVYSMYPGQLSGGMCQCVMFASVTAQSPKLIIADEPCSSLDICSKLVILDLLKSATLNGTSVLIITHDINEAKYLTENIVFSCGRKSSYEKSERVGSRLTACDETVAQKVGSSHAGFAPLIRGKNITKTYGHGQNMQYALRNVSFSVERGKCIGIIGMTGSGKTTLARIIAGLCRADSGELYFNGKTIQMIFQNPYDSLTKSMCIGEQIREAVRANKIVDRKNEYSYVCEVLRECGLSEEFYGRYPDRLSGGQCQRACIARAVAVKPEFIICDEVLSSLDEEMHAQIIVLLCRLKKEYGISMLYISHELKSVCCIADDVAVMEEGRIVEYGNTEEVFNNPEAECTKRLVEVSRKFMRI